MRNSRNFKKTIVSLIMAFVMAFVPMTGTGTMTAYAIANGTPVATNQNDDVDQSKAKVNTAAEEAVPDNSRQGSEQKSQAKEESSQNSVNKDKAEAKEAENYVKEEATKSDNQEDATKPDDTESDQTRSKYQWQDDHMKVTAVLEDPSAIPDDAELVVKAISEGSKGYNYDAYMEALNSNSESKYDGNNTLLYDVAFIKDGVELQPESGTVSVTFEFLDEQLSDSIGAKKTSDVNVIHLPLKKKIKEQFDTTADARDISAGDIKVEEVTKADNALAVNVKNETVNFETSDFSVFAYTVDFEYGEYKFSIPGEGSIELSKVFKKLHIDKDVNNVKSVTFSNTDLVEVEENKGFFDTDWTLTSKKAFSTEETLTITMKDGSEIIIKVTDAQDGYEVAVNFVSQDQSVTVTPGSGDAPAISGNYFARADIVDSQNNVVGWGITPISLTQSNPVVSINSFKECTTTTTTDPDTGVETTNYTDTGSQISYADAITAGYTVKNVRIVSGNNPNNGNEAHAMDSSDPDGYTFVSNVQNDDKTRSVVTLRVANESKYFVRVISDKPLTIPEGVYLYAWVTVEHTTGTNTEALVPVTSDYSSDGGKTFDIPVTEWEIPYQGKAPNEKITGHEKKVTVKLWAGSEEGVIYSPANAYNGKLNPIAEGGVINDYIVKHYPVVPKDYPSDQDYERVTSADNDNKVTYRYDIVRLSKDTNQLPEYSLEYILNGYNVVTLCDPSDTTVRTHDGINYVNGALKNDTHMMGGALIRGELSGDAPMIADSSLLTKPSYVGSFANLSTQVSVNGRNANNNPPDFYIGSQNIVIGDTVNGVDFKNDKGLNRQGRTIANSNYIDWDRLRNEVVSTSNTLIEHATTVTVTNDLPQDSGAYIVTIHGGQNITISNPDNLPYKIKIVDVGDASKEDTKATVVNVLDSGDTALPMLYQIDGATPGSWLENHSDPDGKGSTKEDGTGLSIVWNFPNATYVTTSSQSPELGHVVAPNADVRIASGDYNGCIVCNSAYSNSEGHQWAYKGGSIIDAAVSFVLKKTVNGVDPTSDQKYTFILQAWDSGWTPEPQEGEQKDENKYQEVQNEGANVNFKEIKWSKDGTYFYLLSEKNTGADEFTSLDGTKFVVKAKVTHTTDSADNIIYSHEDTYYKLEKDVDVTTVIGDDGVITGEKVTELSGPDDAMFVNTVTGGLAISKEVSNERNSTQKFKFEVSLKDKDNNDLTGTVSAVISEADKDDVGKTYTLNNGKFEVELTPAQTVTIVGLTPGTKFEVGEKATAGYTQTTPANNGNFSGTIEAGKTQVFAAHFINEKTEEKSATASFGVTKNFTGRTWGDADTFKFTVECVDNAPAPTDLNKTATKNEPSVSFGDITYNAVGTYIYNITEEKGNLPGVTYDEGTYVATVKVVEDSSSETGLSATVTYSYKAKGSETTEARNAESDGTVKVTNTYAAEGTGEIKVKKTLTGRDWTNDDEFTFTIEKAADTESGTPLPDNTSITIKKSDEDQTKSFGEIKFKKAGTYKYVVKETKGSIGGVTYDTTEHTVTIKVKDNGKGKLVADGCELIQTKEFTNTYAAEGTGEIKVKKTLTGRDWTNDDEFTFTIEKAADTESGTPLPDNTSITIKKSDEDQTKSFGEIKFKKAGTYKYVVKETKGSIGGVTYDTTEHTVTIKVKDNGKGKLVADGCELIQTKEFTNTYAAEGTGEIKVKKTLTGRDWTNDDEFTFTIEKAADTESGTPLPDNTSITIKKSDEDQTKSFGEIKFKKAGTYKYVVKETKGSIGGVTYDTTEHTVTIKVKDNGKGKLVADGCELIQTKEFTNTYAAEGTGEIKVKKTLTGRDWTNDDEFTFTIEKAADTESGTPLPDNTSITIKKSDEDQTKSFGEIKFKKAGTYKYVVKETKGSIGGVTYDTTEHTVTIKVKDNGKGKLVADGCELIQTKEFTNTYAAEGTGEIKVKKTLTGRDWTNDDEFTFTIEKAADTESGTPLPDNTSITIKKSDEDQTKSFGEIKFKKAGTYKYVVKETKGSIGGVTYDTTEHTVTIKVKDNGKGKLVADGCELIQTKEFTNTYAAEGTGEIKVKKTLTGRDWTNDDEFTFTIEKAADTESGTPLPDNTSITIKKSDEDQTKSFGEIKFKKAGTYKYVVKETKGSIGGVTYDTTEHTVTIKVKDNGKGKLVADGCELIQTKEFTNTYAAEGTGEIKVKKTLTGRDWTNDDEFTFTIEKAADTESGTPLPDNTSITIKKSDEDQTKSFGEIKFKKAGTYKYVVKETKGSIGGVTYDTTEHTVTIKVKDNGKGKLVADGCELIQTKEFTNTYAAEGTGEIKVKKTLTGRDWTNDDEFTFTIEKAADTESGTPLPDNTSITIKKSDEDQTKSFGEIKFKKAGTYKYVVKETKGSIGGVTYDTTEHTVTIKVKDNGKGKLVADGCELIQTEEFTNTYAAEGTGEIKVKKTLTGRDWTNDDEFTFTIEKAADTESGTPLPDNTSITIKKSDEDQTKSFGEIKFKKAGTYKYVVKETKGSIGGVTYDTTEHTVTIKVKDNGKGKLVTDGCELIQTKEFTNTYAAEGTGEIKVKKTLTGRDWTNDDEFTFTIEKAADTESGTPLPDNTSITIKKSDEDQTKSFGEIKFKKAGTYKYVVKETKGSIGGVTYDTTEHTVTIKVKDNGKGKLVADGCELIQTKEFTNTYAAEGTGEIKVKKTLTGRDWTNDDEFTFTIEKAADTESGTPLPDNTSITIKKSDEDQTKSFGEIKFKKAGTYTYKVKETKGTLGGVTYDTTEHTVTIEAVDDGNGNIVAKEGSKLIQTEEFTNTYAAEGTGEIKVKKTLTGRDWTNDDEFTFTISADEGTPLPADRSITIKKADKDQTKSFGEIKFKKAGTYTYKVKETKGTLGGVTYDTTEHTVTIEAVDDGNGNIVAKEGSKLIQTEEFTNTYAAEGTGEIKVKKTLTGRDWTNDDEFTFTISADEGTPLPADRSITIKKADKDQTKSFGEIKFTKAGTYTYKVKETKGTLGGVTYDTTEHTVTIEAVDDGKGHIVAKEGSKLIQTEEFTNTYAAEGTGEIKVKKTLEGRKWTADDEFEFTLSGSGNAPMPEEDTIVITKADKDRTVSFGKIDFDEPGKYTYTVKETKGDSKGVTYDTKKHKVTIEVVDDGNGNLVAKKGTKLIQTVKITNVYKEAGGTRTGDDTNLVVSVLILLSSVLALLIIVVRRRRSKSDC